jgi:hypothetical protein
MGKITNLAVFVARIIVIGTYTFIYVTPLYILFYLIIFKNVELLDEISLKYYSIAYLIGFVINYLNIKNSVEKEENQSN